jgi:ATP phosphoribosyltransferase
MQDGVFRLLADTGIEVRVESRGYRASVNLPGFEAKILKPQNIVEMLHAGSRDIGFAGADWVAELDGDLVELVDTGLDPVSLVAAAPTALLEDGALPGRSLVVASEYERLTTGWLGRRGVKARFVRSYGATEVFPPDDADVIVDNTATGATLRAHQLAIVDELMTSSTRLYASRSAWEDPRRREVAEGLALLIRSVLDARQRVMLEVNVSGEDLDRLIEVIPAMREPTVASLHGSGGFAIKAAVPREQVPELIPRIKACGGTDVVVTEPSQIVS